MNKQEALLKKKLPMVVYFMSHSVLLATYPTVMRMRKYIYMIESSDDEIELTTEVTTIWV